MVFQPEYNNSALVFWLILRGDSDGDAARAPINLIILWKLVLVKQRLHLVIGCAKVIFGQETELFILNCYV